MGCILFLRGEIVRQIEIALRVWAVVAIHKAHRSEERQALLVSRPDRHLESIAMGRSRQSVDYTLDYGEAISLAAARRVDYQSHTSQAVFKAEQYIRYGYIPIVRQAFIVLGVYGVYVIYKLRRRLFDPIAVLIFKPGMDSCDVRLGEVDEV
tara:strand:+ start:169 stop:624 length:456 start_codon:yes stop_codon:yes gene_type:complete